MKKKSDDYEKKYNAAQKETKKLTLDLANVMRSSSGMGSKSSKEADDLQARKELINYQSNKSKRNTPDRVSLSKYCRWCGRHTEHRETR